MPSSTITIKVPPDLRLAFRLAAFKRGQTMTDILLETIKKVVQEDKANEKEISKN